MNSLLDKTEEEIKKEVITLATEETGIKNFKSTGVLRGLLEVFSKIIYNIYTAYLAPIFKQTAITTASDNFLSQWGLMLGVVRKPATKTLGNITITAYQAGTLAKGLWVTVEGTNYRFKVLKDYSFEEGVFVAEVEAEFEGTNYNITNDSGIFNKVVAGVESVYFGENWITTPGEDIEEDELYRLRITNKWMSQGVGNPPASFIYYAESVEGVQEIKLIRTPRGYGTVDIIVVATNGLPTQTLLNEVYNAIGDHGLICNDLQVKAPEVVNTDIEIEFSGESTENLVQETVLNYVYSLGIGGYLEIREIYNTLEPLNLEEVEVIQPSRNVSADDSSIIIANVIVRKK